MRSVHLLQPNISFPSHTEHFDDACIPWLTQCNQRLPNLKLLRSQYSLITGLLEGKTLTERLEEGGRLYRADYTAGFADYIEQINAQKKPEGATNVPWLTKDRTQHAGKALFYYT